MWIIASIAAILLFTAVWYVWLRKIPMATSDGAIIMSLGIMLNGAFQSFDLLKKVWGPFFIPLLFLLLVWLLAGHTSDAVTGSFYSRHLAHPVSSFAAGTWVAAISVTIIAITKELPQIRSVAVSLFGMNLLLWAGYMVLVVRNYCRFFREPKWLLEVHGVLLLACVATQSVVISAERLWTRVIPPALSAALILLGLLFYCAGTALILYRYSGRRFANLADNWQNTNCIVHGALSITGLACAVSRVFPGGLVTDLWLFVIVLFAAVELVELARGWQRVRKYGWRQGLLTYASHQWARNFTFGMFLAFTMNLQLRGGGLPGSGKLLVMLQSAIAGDGKYIVIALFAAETALLANRIAAVRMQSTRRGRGLGGGGFSSGQGV